MNLTVNRTLPPQFVIPSLPGLAKITTANYNGLNVWEMRGGTSSLTRLDAVWNAGGRYFPRPYRASALARMLLEGSSQQSSVQFQSAVDQLGAYFGAQASADHLWVTVYQEEERLAETLELIASALQHPRWDISDWKAHSESMLQEHQVAQQRTRFHANRMFLHHLLGDSSYGRLAEAADITQITPEMLAQHHAEYVAPFQPRLFFSARQEFDASKTMDNLEFLAKGNIAEEQLSQPIYQNAPGSRHHTPVPNAVQASLVLGKHIPSRTHVDYPALYLAVFLLGGYFGSRLSKNIREEKGLTYGISAQCVHRQLASYVQIAADLKSDSLQMALDEVFNEVKTLSLHPPKDEELNNVRNYLSGSYVRNFDGVLNTMETMRPLLLNGLSSDWSFDFYQRLMATSAEEITAAAARYLQPESFVVSSASGGGQ